MLILHPSGILLKKLQVYILNFLVVVVAESLSLSLSLMLISINSERGMKIDSIIFWCFYRRCDSPWAHYPVSVSWFSWDKFPSWSTTKELHRWTGRISEDWILAFGWRRWSPILGGTWWSGAHRDGNSVFGNGYCEQETRHSSFISIEYVEFSPYFRAMYIY